MRRNIKYFGFIFLVIFLSLSLSAQKKSKKKQKKKFDVGFNQCDNSPWLLAFEDNFDGNTLDLSKWDVITGVNRDPYFESSKQWYSPENIIIEDGILKLVLKKANIKNQDFDIWMYDRMEKFSDNFEYSTAEIWAIPFFQYGKFEAKIKIPRGKGFWPAFWLFGDFASRYNEIDIFEFWNEKNMFHKYKSKKLTRVHRMNVHFDHDSDGKSRMDPSHYKTMDFSEDFFIFTLIWGKDKIEWYVNGELKRSDSKYYKAFGKSADCDIKPKKRYKENNIFPSDPMRVILSVGIQNGNDRKGNSKSPDDDNIFPSYMEVDWVRCYKRQSSRK